jgi:flagellar motility protein MotE (MotC chaperone)
MAVATVCALGLPQLLSKAGAENATAPAPKPAAEAVKEPDASAQQPPNASRAAREEKAIQDARRQQLADKEAALAAKEQELKKMSARLDAQLKALEESKKQMDESRKAQTSAQKKAKDEKISKMVKLFKTLKGEQAGKLIDSMQEDLAMGLLSRMDTKSVAKLAPYINQPRVLKWVSDNLREK